MKQRSVLTDLELMQNELRQEAKGRIAAFRGVPIDDFEREDLIRIITILAGEDNRDSGEIRIPVL